MYLPDGRVPEDILLAFRAVRLTPLEAGSVAGNLASATVPVRLAAGKSIPNASTVALVGATPVRLLPSIAGKAPDNLDDVNVEIRASAYSPS